MRAGVVILDGARLAVIRRQRDGRLYHVIPGGGIEAGETAEDAACREAHEELGLTVQILGSIGRVVFAPPDGSSRYEQHYFGAEIVEGDFGTGTGPEYAADRDPARGIYEPIWLDLSTDILGVVLTNAVHPTVEGKAEAMQKFRPRLYELIAKAGEAVPPDPARATGSAAFSTWRA